MKKNQIIILVALIILIIGGIFYWATLQKAKLPLEEEVTPEEVTPEEIVTEEIFGLSGIVSKVDAENIFLMVIPTGKESEVKVIISEDTKLFKVLYSSERGNPEFVTKRKEITIEEIKEGNRVFIKTNINIAGMKEFNDVDYIEVL